MIEPLERVRDALREHDCRPGDGDRFNCRCPAHDDRSPSLSVAVGADGRVLMTCQAGCAFEDVVAKLGLETSDLFVARNGDSADRRIAATYDYVDEQGALLYQVVRYEPKDFRQRRPGTNGEEWVWNLRGVRRVLYRLPKVVEAIKAKQTVWLTEGERDVHSLEDGGVTATTCAMGAGKGKWRGEYTEALRGAHVVIVGDNDELGQEHVRLVAEKLKGKAASITLKRCPDGHKDVTDWLGSGGTLDGLELLADGQADEGERKSVVTLASDVRSRRVRWAWKGYMPLGYLTIQTGESKLGKSTFFCHTAARLAQGRLTGEFFGKSAQVLIVAAEDSPRGHVEAQAPGCWRRFDLTAFLDMPDGWNFRAGVGAHCRCAGRASRSPRLYRRGDGAPAGRAQVGERARRPPSCVARSGHSRTLP